jgi:aspartate kinase (EC 2.7.2.4)
MQWSLTPIRPKFLATGADRPGVAARLFGEIASQDLDVDLIIQSIHEGNSNDIALPSRRTLSTKQRRLPMPLFQLCVSHCQGKVFLRWMHRR